MKPLVSKLVTALCAVTLVLVVAVVVIPGLFGLQRYVITGGSMTGTIPKGAVIYSKITPVEQLKVGDIITFTPPGMPSGGDAPHHRRRAGPDGRPSFRTKGDFNEAADPGTR